jgi:Pyruvate/2-oxoacid:ferredoxin oxidoreductase delta subunit
MLLNEIPSARPHIPGTKMSVYHHSGSSYTGLYPWVDAFRCTGCKACAKACPPGIIGFHKGKAAIVLDLCQQCGECFEACPVEGAIIFKLPPGSPETGNIPFVSRK